MTGTLALDRPGDSGNPAIVSMLAGTAAGQVVEGCIAGAIKSLLVNVAVVSRERSGHGTGEGDGQRPMVQDTPNKGAVVPLTLASRLTASPFWEEAQLKPPVIVPGLAVKPMVGVIPGTNVSSTERGPYS